MAHVRIDMHSSQQQHSSDSMQNNNGNNRSPVSTGVGAQEKFVPIPVLLEMGASRLGVLVCGSVVMMLVQGGIFVIMETKDRVSVTVLFFLVCFRCWRYFYPKNIGSLTEASQSLSADNIQQLAIPIGFMSRLCYWWNLISVMTCVILSMMRLASQDFGQTEVANKGAREFALNVFYGLAFAEALMLLFALTFVTIMAVQRKVTEALIGWVKPSQLAQAPPTHQNATLLERAECRVHPNSVGYSHLPASEPHDSVEPSQLAQALSTHHNTALLEISLHLFPNLRTLNINKLIEPPSVHDLFRTINWRNLKYIHPSLECSLRRRVSRPRQLLLIEDYSDNSEDNLPHLKVA